MSTPPILEFDPDRSAIIEPTAWFRPIDGIAARAVISWMHDAVETLLAGYDAIERTTIVAESTRIPVREIVYDGVPVVVVEAAVGGAISAGILEALIGHGCEIFVAVGSSGGLTGAHPPGTVVVPEAAIRDEGVSYHYLAPAREVALDTDIQRTVSESIDDAGLQVVHGKVWTTDAIFRETAKRVRDRVAEGALAVDMECASLAAVARFRAVRLGHAVYVADTLHGETWDAEALVNPDGAFRARLLEAAVRAAVNT